MRDKITVPIAISSVAIFIIIVFVAGVTENIPTHIQQYKTVKIPQKVVDANNSFAIQTYKEISSREEFANSNIFFSPISMYISLSSLYEGAGGSTIPQMNDIFRLEPDSQKRYELIKDTMTSLNHDEPHLTLDMANALWSTKQYKLSDSYITLLQDTYQTHVDNVDFSSEKSKGVINQWASDNTNGLIKKVYKKPINSADNTIVLTNTAYVNGIWQYEFPKNEEYLPYQTHPSSSFVEPMAVSKTILSYTDFYSDAFNLRVLQLPYAGDRFSMLLLDPICHVNIKELENALSPHLIKKWQNDLKEREDVSVLIPKFSIKTSYDMIDILKDMQIQNIFSKENANLTDLVKHLPSNEKPHISATHSAFININEKGVEPAVTKPSGYTYMKKSGVSVVPGLPFIFIIQDDESGAILFMGKVSDPAAG
ncbi:MAG: serpin family protein [Thaumarchaeota archaeon]|nr:serpin family protein [Nitrososphaerota archaeon]